MLPLGSVKEGETSPEILFGATRLHEAAPQIEIMCLHTAGAERSGWRISGHPQLELELISHGLRDLDLDLEHIPQVPLVGLGPQRETVAHTDELCRQAQRRSGATHTSFEHGSDLQLLADRPDIDVPSSLEPESGSA